MDPGRLKPDRAIIYFFSLTSTLARVFSHSMRIVHLLPDWSNAIVKFSTGAEVFDAVISVRVKSSPSPGYGTPHSPVFLLTTSVHLSGLGTAKIV
jgi:hypothetical protein